MSPPWRLAALAATLLSTILPSSALPTSAHDDHPSLFLPHILPATWLDKRLETPNLVIIDIRDNQSFTSGHIPSSISLPFQGNPFWSSNGPQNQTLVMPTADVIGTTLTNLGLSIDSLVVIVPDSAVLPSHMAMATRAATTLRYAGMSIKNLAILDGGYPAWVAGNFTVSVTPGRPQPGQEEGSGNGKGKVFDGKIDASFVVERDYVRSRIGKVAEGVVLIDARAEADYRAGHIESAFSLPTTGIWKQGGFWKSAEELRGMFAAAVGDAPVGRKRGEVVVYCRSGMLATAWVYTLTSVLGFENVKLYDGSWEDWARHGEAVSVS